MSNNIVNFHTRTPFVPPPETKEGGPCKASITYLEKLLEEAKEGKIRGFALCHMSEDIGWFKHYLILNEEIDPITQLVYLSVGASELQKYAVFKASPEGDDYEDGPEDMSS